MPDIERQYPAGVLTTAGTAGAAAILAYTLTES